MKFIIFFLLLAPMSFAAHLPQSWVNEHKHKSFSASTLKDLNDTHNFLDSVLNVQEKVLMGREEKSPNGFKFSQYVTDFSLSKSGLFGLSALKATTAVELKWKRASLQKMKDFSSELEVVDDSKEALRVTASQVEALAVSTGKVEASAALKTNIEEVLSKVKAMMEQMDHMDFPGWQLTSMRLDLSIGANGQVWTFAKAGASVRVRLDWKKIRNGSNKTAMMKNMNSSFINKILYDFNEIYKEQNLAGFKVKMVNVGVGLSLKGSFLGLSSTKAGIIGYLRFVPVPVNNKMALKIIDVNSDLATEGIEYLADSELEASKNMNLTFLPRNKWKAGLLKGLMMAKFFAGSADRFQNIWQVSEIKTVFELSKSGFLGLASTSATGTLETELVRK